MKTKIEPGCKAIIVKSTIQEVIGQTATVIRYIGDVLTDGLLTRDFWEISNEFLKQIYPTKRVIAPERHLMRIDGNDEMFRNEDSMENLFRKSKEREEMFRKFKYGGTP